MIIIMYTLVATSIVLFVVLEAFYKYEKKIWQKVHGEEYREILLKTVEEAIGKSGLVLNLKRSSIDTIEWSMLDAEMHERLKKVKRIDISNSNINDLEFLRYFERLETIVASKSAITELTSLQASSLSHSVKVLLVDHTRIESLRGLENMSAMTGLDISHTKVSSLEPIKNTNIGFIDAHNTRISWQEVKKNKPKTSVVVLRGPSILEKLIPALEKKTAYPEDYLAAISNLPNEL